MQIDNEVPFGKSVYAWLYVHNLTLDSLVKHDRMEEHYLAWETVRRQTNPYFIRGTGFEGYLIGICPTPEQALETILDTNQNILEAIARAYRFEPLFRSHLMKTLLRERSDTPAIQAWSAFLGAALGKLRCQIARSPAAAAFRSQTYQLIHLLPPMTYHTVEGDVLQSYAVAGLNTLPPRIAVSLSSVPPSRQDAWLVAENIGEFGHPLVRQLLDRH